MQWTATRTHSPRVSKAVWRLLDDADSTTFRPEFKLTLVSRAAKRPATSEVVRGRVSGGSIVSYAWEFGDGTAGRGKRPSHLYTRTGSFRVKLTGIDDSGDSSTTIRTVTVH